MFSEYSTVTGIASPLVKQVKTVASRYSRAQVPADL
jgi:hypothetical protein